MTIQKARQILGTDSTTLSDSQLEELLKSMSVICDDFLDMALTTSGSNLILKKDIVKSSAVI